MKPADPSSNRWPAFIREVRAAKHWSQADLGAFLDADQASVSRWERGLVLPGFEVRKQLESLAEEVGLQSLCGIEMIVRASPFPMILVDSGLLVVAASASSGFVSGKTCIEQTPEDERAHLVAFVEELRRVDFWSTAEGRSFDYSFARTAEVAGAVLVPVTVRGEVYAVVQRREPAREP